MPASFQDIVNSRLFKFTVGEAVDGKPSEFFVHEDAIAQLSNPLHTLTKGPSEDARAGRATWNDVSKETFERFAQFAYTGDYTIPKTEDRNAVAKKEKVETAVLTPPTSPKAKNGIRNGSVSLISTVQPQEKSAATVDNDDPATEKLLDDEGTILNYPSTPLNKRNKKKKRTKSEAVKPPIPDPQEREPAKESAKVQEVPEPEPERAESVSVDQEQEPTSAGSRDDPLEMLTEDFHTLSYPLVASRDNYDGTCEPATAFEKERSYSKVFLSHASLYALGRAQLVDPLKALALFKLHKTLSAFELENENIGDITDLARYAYSEDGKKVDEGLGGLKGLVCQYMGRHAMALSQDTKFLNFLMEGGQVVKDFLMLKLQSKN